MFCIHWRCQPRSYSPCRRQARPWKRSTKPTHLWVLTTRSVGFFKNNGPLYRSWIPAKHKMVDMGVEQLVLPLQCCYTILKLAHSIHLGGYLEEKKRWLTKFDKDSIGQIHFKNVQSIVTITKFVRRQHLRGAQATASYSTNYYSHSNVYSHGYRGTSSKEPIRKAVCTGYMRLQQSIREAILLQSMLSMCQRSKSLCRDNKRNNDRSG